MKHHIDIMCTTKIQYRTFHVYYSAVQKHQVQKKIIQNEINKIKNQEKEKGKGKQTENRKKGIHVIGLKHRSTLHMGLHS